MLRTIRNLSALLFFGALVLSTQAKVRADYCDGNVAVITSVVISQSTYSECHLTARDMAAASCADHCNLTCEGRPWQGPPESTVNFSEDCHSEGEQIVGILSCICGPKPD
jgi:hypothetical protein